MYVLSRSQIKTADRVGGIELMVPWPEGEFGPPPEKTGRPTTEVEHRIAERLLQAECERHGLVLVRSRIVRIRRPRRAGGGVVTHVACIIIGRRWVHAGGGKRALIMWATLLGSAPLTQPAPTPAPPGSVQNCPYRVAGRYIGRIVRTAHPERSQDDPRGCYTYTAYTPEGRLVAELNSGAIARQALRVAAGLVPPAPGDR